jgi:ribosomal protein S18 acetylase RimI-like enzyme
MIKIVKAEENHIPAIKKLWVEFLKYSEEFHPIFAIREGAEMDMEKEFLRPAMGNKNKLVLIALDGGKAVAYSVSEIQEPHKLKRKITTASIDHLFVTEDCRREGIGGKMYAEILKWFKAEGVDRIELHVVARNKAACSFWRKQGYGDFQYVWQRDI